MPGRLQLSFSQHKSKIGERKRAYLFFRVPSGELVVVQLLPAHTEFIRRQMPGRLQLSFSQKLASGGEPFPPVFFETVTRRHPTAYAHARMT